ncbi:MAG: hypothetical protein EXR77_17990 [Myxococcales bacterium]|nr:hypothetical protein [Myxococcales bacterium]
MPSWRVRISRGKPSRLPKARCRQVLARHLRQSPLDALRHRPTFRRARPQPWACLDRCVDGILALEDGRFFRGHRFGARLAPSDGSGAGEVVFNTLAQGYQEILTDPSYVGQIVTLTRSHVGNYGVNRDDPESAAVRAAGLVVRDHHAHPSNWRADRSLDAELRDFGVPGLGAVDTRALTIHLRDFGAQRGVIADWPVASRLPLAGWPLSNTRPRTITDLAGAASARAGHKPKSAASK